MKSLIKIILIGSIFGLNFVSAQEKPIETPKVSRSDQFLSFVLSKAEKYSEKGEVALGKAVDTIVEETPQVAEEFVKYRIFLHLWRTFALLPLIFISYYAGKKFYKLGKESDFMSGGEVTGIFGTVFSAIAGLISLGFVAYGLIGEFPYAIQAMVAPKVYIIEQAINLLK